MFCLRSWIPVLFFLTSASPLYALLFLIATYFLNRPCVYCSLLLAILVLSIFDFSQTWFEPLAPFSTAPLPIRDETAENNNSTTTTRGVLGEAVMGTAGVLASAANESMKSLAHAVVNSVRQKTPTGAGAGLGLWEWVRQWVAGKREWRVACLDVVIRV